MVAASFAMLSWRSERGLKLEQLVLGKCFKFAGFFKFAQNNYTFTPFYVHGYRN